MDTLPATAVKVLGQFLDPCDSYSCRLSSRCLSPVVPREQSSSHIRVVANSFQHQLQQEQEQKKEQEQNQQMQIQQQQERQQQAQQQPEQQDEAEAQDQSANCGPRTRGPPADQGDTRGPRISDTRGPRISEPFTPRSRTAASLTRAAASFGYRQAHVYVDVLQQYQGDTWQQMFGALLSSHCIDTLVIIEYSSTSLSSTARAALAVCNLKADLATLTLTPPQPPPSSSTSSSSSSSAAAAAEVAAATAITGRWLPDLAAAYTAAVAAANGSSPPLQHLDLQLPAPLPYALQPLLLQLTWVKTLKLISTRVWPHPLPQCIHKTWLLSSVIAGLSTLCSLDSLTCSLSAPQTSNLDAQVATKLQQLFSSQVMSHLTHLELGTSSRSSQLMLSAPLVSLHSLKSLTCQPGFYVDVEDAQDCMYQPSNATAASGSSVVTSSPIYQLAPSLTKLVLNEGSINDHEQLLKLLVGKGIPATTAAAMTQLQHLEINSRAGKADVLTMWRPTALEALNQLSGLRHFKTFGGDVARAANSATAAQLLGLTVLCEPTDMGVYGLFYYPMPTITNFTSLTSLAIQGPTAVSLNPQQHFKQLCALPSLKHFVFNGKVEDANERHHEVCKLPTGLQSLVLRHHDDHDDPTSKQPVLENVKFSVETFPSSLTSVKFEGWDFPLLQEVDEEGDEPSELRNIEELSIQVGCLHQASPFLRHCSNLQWLSLTIRYNQRRITHKHRTASSSAGNSSSQSHNADDVLPLSKLCPNLQELHVKLENGAQSGSLGNNMIRTYPPADHVFSSLWPEVTQPRGLRKLSLNIDGMLSLWETLMPNLSALSSLNRLQHLALRLVVHLDPPPKQGGLEDGTAQAVTSVEEQLACDDIEPDESESDYLDGPHVRSPDEVHSTDWPDWWQGVMRNSDDWLVETLTRSCTNLRTLNLRASAIYAENYMDFECGATSGRCRHAPMSKCFRAQLLHGRERVALVEQELPNCLVLKGKYDNNVHD